MAGRTAGEVLRAVETERIQAGADEDAEPGVAGKTWAAVKEAVFGAVKVTRPGDESTPLLLPGTEPLIRANLTLQLQAARLALLRGQQSIFDQSLEERVRAYQRERRLTVDGLVGQQTQIAMNTDLGAENRPRLSRVN